MPAPCGQLKLQAVSPEFSWTVVATYRFKQILIISLSIFRTEGKMSECRGFDRRKLFMAVLMISLSSSPPYKQAHGQVRPSPQPWMIHTSYSHDTLYR